MVRRFTIDRPRSLLENYYGVSPEGTEGQRLHVRRRAASRTKPDLVLHDGPNDQCPVRAVSHILAMSPKFKLGLGDPADENSVVWEDMTRPLGLANNFSWSMVLPSDGHGYDRRSFVWKRTRHVTADGMAKSALSSRNWKLLDAGAGAGADADADADADTHGGGTVLAVFTAVVERGKCGTLQVNVEYGAAFDTMVFITCLSLYERARRE
ncbi:E3 ubiquitin-protein ligase [Purpureocillium lavendulum]|uniref:E3 ubiquitin-protein ligase n=1 Tax=Purpureocillium lavendulum TaxID=1247861 RepID=A0AB34FVM4_9HYPO|nr:E3 ubiquitin-protein ligase [Purpureocillium lavendulum]